MGGQNHDIGFIGDKKVIDVLKIGNTDCLTIHIIWKLQGWKQTNICFLIIISYWNYNSTISWFVYFCVV